MSLFARHLGTRLGAGSSGEVFKARVWPSGRTVAVKRLALANRGDESVERRLRHEASVATTLEHENIVRLLGFDATAEHIELTMEYVDGMTLHQLVESCESSEAAMLHIARSVLRALAYAHRAGVVHRDISPHNVLIGWDGFVKVSDFGMAKPNGCPPTTNGGVQGTVPYSSPEQLKRRLVDSRSDLFSAGAILYELVTGRRPWEGSTFEVIFKLTVKQTPVEPVCEVCPWVSREFGNVIERLLAFDVESRYQSADEALADLPIDDDGRESLVSLMASFPGRSKRGRWKRTRTATWAIFAVVFLAYLLMDSEQSTHQDISVPQETDTSVRSTTNESRHHPSIHSTDGKLAVSRETRTETTTHQQGMESSSGTSQRIDVPDSRSSRISRMNRATPRKSRTSKKRRRTTVMEPDSQSSVRVDSELHRRTSAAKSSMLHGIGEHDADSVRGGTIEVEWQLGETVYPEEEER